MNPAASRRLVSVGLAILLAAAVFLAYRPALSSGFLNWDDPDTVVGNAAVTDASPGGLVTVLTGRIFATWLPVYFLSLWLDHAVFGLAPFAFHAVNVLLHVAAALVVLALARRISGRLDVAWGAAFLFALHPAAVQSVAWISERKGLLAFVLGGLSILAFLRAGDREGRRRWALHAWGTAALAAALLAKGSALAVPLVLALLLPALRGRAGGGRRAVELAPYFAVAGLLAAVHFAIAREEGTALAGPGPGAGALLLTDVPVLARYLRLAFVPLWGQSAIHHVALESGLSGRVLAGLAVLAVFAAALVVAWRRDRGIFFGLAAAAVALAPFNNVFPRTTVLFAERYLYFSLFGASLALSLAVAAALRRAPVAATGAALAALAVVFGGFAAARAAVWGDPVTLFADAEGKAPESWLASMKLGEALADRARAGEDGRWAAAAAAFERAAGRAETPLDDARARANLSGVLLAMPGRAEEALAAAAAASARLPELKADDREALLFHLEVNRGSALSALGRPAEAAEAYRAAARVRPRDPAPLAALVGALLGAGDAAGALEAGREAVALAPEDETASVVLAQAELAGSDVSSARHTLEALLARRPDAVTALVLLGKIEVASNRPIPARERFAAALAARPGLASARRGMAEADLLLARWQWAKGEKAEAAATGRRAAEEDPENVEALLFVGTVEEDVDAAEAALARAAGMPGGGPARDLLATRRLLAAVAALDAGRREDALRFTARALGSGAAVLRLSRGLEVAADLPGLDALAAEASAAGREDALVGLLLALAGRGEEAEERLAAALSAAQAAGAFSGPAVYLALTVRGRSRLERGEAARARDDFAILSELHPEDPRPAEGRAEALFHLAAARLVAEGGDPETVYAAAREAAERAVALAPDRLEARLAMGRVEFATGRTVEALKRFRDAKRDFPDRLEPRIGLADLYRLHYGITGEKVYLDAARQELQEAVDLEPSSARARAAFGEVLLASGDGQRAATELATALALDPGLESAKVVLAEIYSRAARSRLEQGGPEGRVQARELAQRAIALGARKAGPHLVLAEISRGDRDYAPAQRELEQARLYEPDSADVKDALASFYKDLGYALLLRREREKAVEAFRKAIEAGSEKVDLAPVREFLGEGDGAPPVAVDPRVEEILARKAAAARQWFEEAGAKLDAGDLPGAAEAAARSIAEVSTAEAWHLMGRIREAQGKTGEAVRAWRNAVRQKPSLLEAWYALGRVHFSLGEWAPALEAWETFLRVAGDDVPEQMRMRVEEQVKELRRTIDEEK